MPVTGEQRVEFERMASSSVLAYR
jgi:transposase